MLAFTLVPILAVVSSVSAGVIGSAGPVSCAQETVAHETFIGKDSNVKLQLSHCAAAPHVNTAGQIISKRATPVVDVCNAPCDTFCFSGGSGGPNEDDCAVIADAILYDSQNVGAIFNATAPGTATDKVTMQYKSCLTYFLNQDSANETLSYCRSDWASLVTWLSSDCNAANSAHGGLCVAQDQRWYVQVQNSSG